MAVQRPALTGFQRSLRWIPRGCPVLHGSNNPFESILFPALDHVNYRNDLTCGWRGGEVEGKRRGWLFARESFVFIYLWRVVLCNVSMILWISCYIEVELLLRKRWWKKGRKKNLIYNPSSSTFRKFSIEEIRIQTDMEEEETDQNHHEARSKKLHSCVIEEVKGERFRGEGDP